MSALVGRHPLKARYYRNVRNAMIAAALIHVAVFAAAPPYRPRPFQMKADVLRVVEAAVPAVPGDARSGAPEPPPTPERTTRERVVADLPIRTQSGAAELATSPGAGAGAGAEGEGAIGEEAPPVFYSYDTPPRATRRVEPEYPAAARAMGAEGIVVVNLNIDERGRILRAWVAQASANEILVNAALDAAYEFEFAPGTQRETPVKCTVAIPFQFTLKKTLELTEGQ